MTSSLGRVALCSRCPVGPGELGGGIGGLECGNDVVLYMLNYYSLKICKPKASIYYNKTNIETVLIKFKEPGSQVTEADMSQGCLYQPKAVPLSSALCLVKSKVAKLLQALSFLS